MNNVIAYVAPKNKTMEHIMSLNNRISCVVGISIFGFKTYWKLVLYLMEIQTTLTFKNFLQSKTLNVDKNKSYYQRYDVKRLSAFHKQEMTKQQIYDNMLARQSGMDYSPGIQFQISIINVEEAKESTTINQPEKKQQNQCRCGSIKHLQVTSKDCPMGPEIRRAKKKALRMGLSDFSPSPAASAAIHLLYFSAAASYATFFTLYLDSGIPKADFWTFEFQVPQGNPLR